MPRTRSFLYTIILLLLVVTVAEVGSFITLSIIKNDWYSLRDLANSRDRLQSWADGEGNAPDVPGSNYVDKGLVPHPYFGYSYPPDGPQAGDHREMTWYGFLTNAGQLYFDADPGRLVIAVVGGSVAGNFVMHGSGAATLRSTLLKDDRFAGKDIVFTTLALGGFKEPQQMLALLYVLSLGAHVDAVVDLGGFNEAVLPFRENIPMGVHPLYPRSWQAFVGNLTPDRRAAIGKVAWLRSLRAHVAQWAGVVPCRISMTCGLVWHVVDHVASVAILHANEDILSLHSGESIAPDPMLMGPPTDLSSSGAVVRLLAENWERSAELMHALGKSRGFRVFTFLQPSPYYGAKPLHPLEKTVLRPGTWPDVYSRLGYPVFQDSLKRLSQNGYPAFDLTGVFDDHPEPLYSDSCCHVWVQGDVILGRVIGEDMLKAW